MDYLSFCLAKKITLPSFLKVNLLLTEFRLDSLFSEYFGDITTNHQQNKKTTHRMGGHIRQYI